ncbi:hypothetical protein BGZ79_008131 [Entomortierella chlamydospora]|nr:hypothetical protein BGZ79_008131 [Entomortierella chlamydospora]
MQDLDPASLLFTQPDEYVPLHLDPSIFESVGDGVAPDSFTIPDRAIPLPSFPEPLESLKLLADHLNPIGQDNTQSTYGFPHTKYSDVDNVVNGRRRVLAMGAVGAWDTAWENDLDQRVQCIDRPNIFDRLLDSETKSTLVSMDSEPPSLTQDASSQESMESFRDRQRTASSDTDAFRQGKDLPVVDTPPHQAKSSTSAKSTVELVLELPPLTKRPRDIVDDCCYRGGFELGASSLLRKDISNKAWDVKVPKTKSKGTTKSNVHMGQADSWRAAGIPLQHDSIVGEAGARVIDRPDKMQLTWETCTEFGPRTQPEMPFVSPYITEAGTRMFEAIYQKHLDYAFKFRAATTVIPYKSLIDCTLLLLGGTPSSIFNFNQDTMEFEMDRENLRIEGCSTASISNGMGLIRIAFGRSLSSYLTFLQGTIVALQETSQEREMNILELNHKARDMGVILERLATLCQCHVEQSKDGSGARFGFYLPPGADVLSMIYCEIMEQPGVSDPLWMALLISILDHASKPYRDILSRWLGITPSAYTGHGQNQHSQTANPRQPSSLLDRGSGSNWHMGTFSDKESGLVSIFDCHLQQSLQGLDPFGEFFVRSRHGWSWDGSEPVILADPLDYDAEFQWNENSPPPSFIDKKLAEQVVEAGKELQILMEFEPRHPLIAHDRKSGKTDSGLKWLYVQADISSNQILQALAARLENMDWISKHKASYERRRRQWRKQKQKGKQRQQTGSIESSLSDAFGGEVDMTSMDMDLTNFRADVPEWLRLETSMDPDLQGFFSLSSNLGQTKDMSLACPDMMEFLLQPSESGSSVQGAFSSASSAFPSNTLNQSKTSLNPSRSRLENMAPLGVLAEQCLGYTIRTRVSLVSTCVMSLYFHDLNLLGHLGIMERFMLMRDGQFIARIGEALFGEETGLLTRTARSAFATATAPTATGKEINRRNSTNSNASASSSWRMSHLSWPPRSGELELTLRAVLLECFQPTGIQDDRSDDETESDSEYMDIEEDESMQRTRKEDAWKRRRLETHELEDMLAFAVKEYDDDSKLSKDVNALEALDFLYLDYKAPRPLRLLFFTPEAYDKYTRLFTFQLRLARVDASLKQIYQRLRMRQKSLLSFSTISTSDKSRLRSQQKQEQQHQEKLQGWQIEMAILHQFRFEAQQIFEGFRGYITDVALGSTWHTFIQRLEIVQARIENRILASYSGPEDDQQFDPKAYIDDSVDADNDDGDHMTPDGLCDLAALHEYHDYILDRMLLQSLLKRKQAPILKVVHGILNCILKLSQYVDRLPEPREYKESTSLEQGERRQEEEEIEARIVKLRTMQDKFRSLCRMLVKVLKVLDERGLGMEGSSSSINPNPESTSASTAAAQHNIRNANNSNVKFLQQLLLRIDMYGFNDN